MKTQFSKLLLIQESALIWVVTIAFIVLAYICIMAGYLGSLPWLTAMASFPWATYAVSQACYYGKSTKENTSGGIVYDSAMASIEVPQPVKSQFRKTKPLNFKIVLFDYKASC